MLNFGNRHTCSSLRFTLEISHGKKFTSLPTVLNQYAMISSKQMSTFQTKLHIDRSQQHAKSKALLHAL